MSKICPLCKQPNVPDKATHWLTINETPIVTSSFPICEICAVVLSGAPDNPGSISLRMEESLTLDELCLSPEASGVIRQKQKLLHACRAFLRRHDNPVVNASVFSDVVGLIRDAVAACEKDG